jgi:hypothetical protein
VLSPVLARTYASKASPGQSSNVSQPQASSAESQDINQSRANDRAKDQDTASTQNPVSHPEAAGMGQQEEPTQSQEEMKRDPSEPDSVKRKKVLEKGGNKKLDPADD